MFTIPSDDLTVWRNYTYPEMDGPFHILTVGECQILVRGNIRDIPWSFNIRR